MKNYKETPYEFNELIKDLEDAKDYIENLIKEMKSSDFEGEQYYKAQITNIYASINRAWNMRSKTSFDELTIEAYQKSITFPTDIL